MANTSPSSNMTLPIPVVGVDPGPDYASNINLCLTIIDAHDHTSGKGVQITPAGININSDLSIQSNNLTLARSIRLDPQSASLSNPSDIGCIYESGADLFYNDANGNQIRITQNGAVAGTPGSIANLVSPATASYSSSTSTFVWQSDANVAANLDAASVVLRNATASSKGLTLSPPASMAADYTVTLPPLPASTLPMSMSNTGVVSTGQITLAQLTAAVQASLTPAGVISAFGGVSAPTGWLMCDGTAVSRSTYSGLFTAMGVAYGSGDGSTTFNLPDLRGQFLRGVDGSAARDPDSSSRTAMNSGGNTGNNIGSIQTSQFGSHNHSFGGGGGAGSSGQVPNSSSSFSWSTTSAGGSETRPINAYVNFIVKT